MKNYISTLLFLLLSVSIHGQPIDYELIILDTASHFNASPYNPTAFDADIIIDSDSVHRAVFYRSDFSVGRPPFNETIWLKRTVSGDCLTGLGHRVLVDSVKQTIAWQTFVSSCRSCNSKENRHIVIAIPTPPADYQVLFENEYLKKTGDAGQSKAGVRSLELTTLPFDSMNDLLPSAGRRSGIIIEKEEQLAESDRSMITTDFSKSMIVANTYGGDCMLKLRPHAHYDAVTKTMVVTVYTIWGGCRAGGRAFIALEVEKPSDRFDIVLHEIQVDSWAEYEEHIGRRVKVFGK